MHKRILALDVGRKRIGVAVSDPLGITAQGVETYTLTDDEAHDMRHIAGIASQKEVKTVLIGMPRSLNGTYGPAADMAKAFGEKLKEYVSAEVEYWDERLTTVQAEKMLIGADVRRDKRRQVIDKMAAVYLLQSYLDANAKKER